VATIQVRDAHGGAVADAVVILDPLDASPPVGRRSATIDQVDRQFVPRVSVVQTGTAVSFPNSDHIRHQVYSFSPTKVFSLKLYAGSPKSTVAFDKPGLVVMGCNIHDSMLGFLAVVDSPYFAKSTADGAAEFMVPPGRYRLRVWHERAAQAYGPAPLTVPDAGMSLPVTLDLSAQPGTPPPWIE